MPLFFLLHWLSCVFDINVDDLIFFYDLSISLSLSSLQALYPINLLFSGSLRFPVQGNGILNHYEHLPRLKHQSSPEFSLGARKINLEIELGYFLHLLISLLFI